MREEALTSEYHTEKTDDTLIFRTSHFTAGRGSVLHRGIYSKEFASALSSLAVAGLTYAVFAANFGKGIIAQVVFLTAFVAGFLALRKFVFEERYMETVFDRSSGKAEIYLVGMTRRRQESIPVADIRDVLIERQRSPVENPDAVEFVEKISSQHGMAIPGFGEEKTFFLLTLKLSDGTGRVIFAGGDMQDAMNAHEEIKGFLGNFLSRG